MIENELQKKFLNGEKIIFDKPTIVLGSASPRRSRLLDQAGIKYVKIISRVDDSKINCLFRHENVNKKEHKKYAKAMAFAKLEPFIGKIENGAVICADTTVYCNGIILEKPLTKEKCIEQHEFISEKTNIVYTAYAIYYNGKTLCKVLPTKVKIAKLSHEVILKICEEPEILDAAGYRCEGAISNYMKIKKSDIANLYGLHIPFVKKMLNKLSFQLN